MKSFLFSAVVMLLFGNILIMQEANAFAHDKLIQGTIGNVIKEIEKSTGGKKQEQKNSPAKKLLPTVEKQTPNKKTSLKSGKKTKLKEFFSAAKRKDYATALRLITPLAEKGDVAGQHWLGVMHKRGWSVPKNTGTAVKYFKLAAKQSAGGYWKAQSQYELGMLHHSGKGVAKNYKTALKYLKESFKQGIVMAGRSGFLLGRMHEEGQGVAKDNILAAYFYQFGQTATGAGKEWSKQQWDDLNSKMSKSQWAKVQTLMAKCQKQDFENCATERDPKVLAAEQIETANAADKFFENKLRNAFIGFMIIDECNKVSTRYISNQQMKTAKSKMKSIQNYYKNKNKKMDVDAVWESASKKWDKDWGGSFKMFAISGRYNKDLNGTCKLKFMGLNSVTIPGAKKKIRKKSF